jgi:hypothetical protein
MLRKEQMRKLVLAAYQLNITKDLIIRLGESVALLIRIQEKVDTLSDIIYRLVAKRAILEFFITARIHYLIGEYKLENNITKSLEIESLDITHIVKKQLEEGYINLTSSLGDDRSNGDEYVGDFILYLTTGEINTVSLSIPLVETNALTYHGIICEEDIT